MALSIRRMGMSLAVVALMVVMLAMSVAPAAQATHINYNGRANGQPAACKAVLTPSSNTNLHCQVKPEGGNEGGSGGGGATIIGGTGSLGAQTVDTHVVTTPSGNINLQGNSHPDQN